MPLGSDQTQQSPKPTPASTPPQQTRTMVFCGQCGTSGNGNFCVECGARLVDAGASASAKGAEPPSYNPYGGTSGMPSPQFGGTASGGTAYSPGGATSGGTRSNVRGVGGTQIPQAETTQGGTFAPATAVSGFVAQPAPGAPQQQALSTALFGSQGYRLDAFHIIARELFVALDRTTYPVASQMMEASKIRRFRELAGKAIPPYFESHVLPFYYQTIGAQCVGSNVLSWDGWNTYLAHKILAGPDEMFAHIGAALRGLNIQLPWQMMRTDFPEYAYPDAAARELQFQQGIRNMAGAALGGGAYNRYSMGGAGGGGSNLAMGMARKGLTGLIANGFLFN